MFLNFFCCKRIRRNRLTRTGKCYECHPKHHFGVTIQMVISSCNVHCVVMFFFQFTFHFSGELILHRERVEQHCSGISEALTQLKTSYQGMLDDHTRQVHQLTLPVPYISESCIEIKIKLNFLFSQFVVPEKVLWRPLRSSW